MKKFEVTLTAKLTFDYVPENYPRDTIEAAINYEVEQILENPLPFIESAIEKEDEVLDGSHLNVKIKTVED